MKCPKCQRRLRIEATSCLCGWGHTASRDEFFKPCAVEGCSEKALVRQAVDIGTADFCIPHYQDYHGQEARKWCEKNGVMTRDKQRAYIASKASKIGKFEGTPEHWLRWSENTVADPKSCGMAIDRARKVIRETVLREPGED